MKPGHWILDGHELVRATLDEWSWWLETHDHHVADTEAAPGVRVSTIFLGLDHNFFGAGPPLLFETLVFDDYGEADQGFARYATWAEAELGHMEAVEAVQARAGVKLEDGVE